MNHESQSLVCQRKCREEERWTLVLLLNNSKKDMFEVTTMERQSSAPDPGAKWIQMSEHVHKVESTCTVVVFPCLKVQTLLFIPFFPGSLPLSLTPFFLFRVLSVSLSWQIKISFFNKYRMSWGFNDPVINPEKDVHLVMDLLRNMRWIFLKFPLSSLLIISSIYSL